MKTLTLALLIATALLCQDPHADSYDCIREVLGSYFSKHDTDRSASADLLVRLYKSDRRFLSWFGDQKERHDQLMLRFLFDHAEKTISEFECDTSRIQLAVPPREAVLSRPLEELNHPSGCVYREPMSRSLYPISNYQMKIFLLRQGDTVVFSDRSFVLGNYLGAGNAAHVWEIQGDEINVLKIPVLNSETENAFYRFKGLRSVEAARYTLKRWAVLRPERNDITVAAINHLGPGYEYALAGKSKGRINGRTFLENPTSDSKYVLRKQRLLQAVLNEAPEDWHQEVGQDVRARQYLLVEESDTWDLVDWESPAHVEWR